MLCGHDDNLLDLSCCCCGEGGETISGFSVETVGREAVWTGGGGLTTCVHNVHRLSMQASC